MSKMDDLLAKKASIELEIKEEKKRLIDKRAKESEEYRESITPEIAKWLLDHMHHTCCSCSDENPCNGFSEYKLDGCRCSKCGLIHYLEDGWIPREYEMELDVRFYRTDVL